MRRSLVSGRSSLATRGMNRAGSRARSSRSPSKTPRSSRVASRENPSRGSRMALQAGASRGASSRSRERITSSRDSRRGRATSPTPQGRRRDPAPQGRRRDPAPQGRRRDPAPQGRRGKPKVSRTAVAVPAVIEVASSLVPPWRRTEPMTARRWKGFSITVGSRAAIRATAKARRRRGPRWAMPLRTMLRRTPAERMATRMATSRMTRRAAPIRAAVGRGIGRGNRRLRMPAKNRRPVRRSLLTTRPSVAIDPPGSSRSRPV